MDIDEFKKNLTGKPRYVLKHADVWVHPEKGYHVIDYLDPIGEMEPIIDHAKLNSSRIERYRSHAVLNGMNFDMHANLICRFGDHLAGKRILDIGCGPGDFLVLLRDREGMSVEGIEPNDQPASFAERHQGLNVYKDPVEGAFWQDRSETYDFVTMWDVLEHVNFPTATFRAAACLLKPGGVLAVGTPCRDSFYHRFGVLSYRLSKGRLPTFLNIMYSRQAFGHKQILSLDDMRCMFHKNDVEILLEDRVHELSCPFGHYIDLLLKSKVARKAANLICLGLWDSLPITNKMVFVGRKTNA